MLIYACYRLIHLLIIKGGLPIKCVHCKWGPLLMNYSCFTMDTPDTSLPSYPHTSSRAAVKWWFTCYFSSQQSLIMLKESQSRMTWSINVMDAIFVKTNAHLSPTLSSPHTANNCAWVVDLFFLFYLNNVLQIHAATVSTHSPAYLVYVIFQNCF